MQLEMPFFENPEEALRDAIRVLGGSKSVGLMLWPDKDVDSASRLLLNCTDANRAEKLDVTQIMRIFRLAREAGHHAPYVWFCSEIGYECKPIVRADEIDRLTSVIENSSKTLASAVSALEKMRREIP